MLRILHLSDIHFGQVKKSELIFHDDVREQLAADLTRLLSGGKSLNLILIGGDISYSGKRKEYDRAVDWLDQLITVGHCDVNAVLTIPGNHDIDVSSIGKAAKLVYADLRNSNPDTAQNMLDEYATESDDKNIIFPKLNTYLNFARGYNSDFDVKGIPQWTRCRDIKPGYRLRIIGMCSVQVSDLYDEQGKMLLGKSQYLFPEDQSVVTLVMVHHPMAWFLDRDDAMRYIHERTSILLTAHEHRFDLNKITPMNGLERIEISAGAITSTKSDGPFKFAYNLLELDVKEEHEGHKVLLSMTAWPRVWGVSAPHFGPDTVKTGGPDSKTITIDCGLKPAPSEVLTMHTEVVSIQGKAMEHNEAADFGRLKHFFWHYLTWDQRIIVLVHAKALPESPENRLPQTIELESLLRAKELGKLALVWDEVMSYVPQEKRKPNPFKQEAA
jgi:hypothetical protein